MLLLATNLGLAAMARWQPARQQPLPPAADPGVAKLVLLAERENAQPEAQSAELAEAPATPAENARDACQSVGPFLTQSDLRRAMTALTPWVKRIRSRQVNLQQSRGWSVFLPAPASREEALDIARQLYARGVRDYYVVTAGEQQNTISLGLFRERGNADRQEDRRRHRKDQSVELHQSSSPGSRGLRITVSALYSE